MSAIAEGIFGIVSGLISPLTELATGWQKKRRAKQDSALRINEAKTNATIKRLETGQNADIAWENLSIAKGGWKDEYWTLVLSIPAVLCFVPGAVGYVRAGFDALSQCPAWYQWMLGVAVASAFGYRKIADFMSLKKGA